MTIQDLFYIVSMICFILIAGFLCSALFYLCRILKIWNTLSAEMEDHVRRITERFSDAIHSIASFKSAFEIALQTVKTVGAVYSVQHKRKRKKKGEEDTDNS